MRETYPWLVTFNIRRRLLGHADVTILCPGEFLLRARNLRVRLIDGDEAGRAVIGLVIGSLAVSLALRTQPTSSSSGKQCYGYLTRTLLNGLFSPPHML